MKTNDKYDRILRPAKPNGDGSAQPSVIIDVYDVERCFDPKSPGLRHALKKILCAGERGHKDLKQDLTDIVTAVNKELMFLESEAHRCTIDLGASGAHYIGESNNCTVVTKIRDGGQCIEITPLADCGSND